MNLPVPDPNLNLYDYLLYTREVPDHDPISLLEMLVYRFDTIREFFFHFGSIQPHNEERFFDKLQELIWVVDSEDPAGERVITMHISSIVNSICQNITPLITSYVRRIKQQCSKEDELRRMSPLVAQLIRFRNNKMTIGFVEKYPLANPYLQTIQEEFQPVKRFQFEKEVFIPQLALIEGEKEKLLQTAGFNDFHKCLNKKYFDDIGLSKFRNVLLGRDPAKINWNKGINELRFLLFNLKKEKKIIAAESYWQIASTIFTVKGKTVAGNDISSCNKISPQLKKGLIAAMNNL